MCRFFHTGIVGTQPDFLFVFVLYRQSEMLVAVAVEEDRSRIEPEAVMEQLWIVTHKRPLFLHS